MAKPLKTGQPNPQRHKKWGYDWSIYNPGSSVNTFFFVENEHQNCTTEVLNL